MHASSRNSVQPKVLARYQWLCFLLANVHATCALANSAFHMKTVSAMCKTVHALQAHALCPGHVHIHACKCKCVCLPVCPHTSIPLLHPQPGSPPLLSGCGVQQIRSSSWQWRKQWRWSSWDPSNPGRNTRRRRGRERKGGQCVGPGGGVQRRGHPL